MTESSGCGPCTGSVNNLSSRLREVERVDEASAAFAEVDELQARLEDTA